MHLIQTKFKILSTEESGPFKIKAKVYFSPNLTGSQFIHSWQPVTLKQGRGLLFLSVPCQLSMSAVVQLHEPVFFLWGKDVRQQETAVLLRLPLHLLWAPLLQFLLQERDDFQLQEVDDFWSNRERKLYHNGAALYSSKMRCSSTDLHRTNWSSWELWKLSVCGSPSEHTLRWSCWKTAQYCINTLQLWCHGPWSDPGSVDWSLTSPNSLSNLVPVDVCHVIHAHVVQPETVIVGINNPVGDGWGETSKIPPQQTGNTSSLWSCWMSKQQSDTRTH